MCIWCEKIIQVDSFACSYPVFPIAFIKEAVSLHCIFLFLSSYLIDHVNVGLFLWSLFCSIDLCVCFWPVPYCFYCISFAIKFEIREHDKFTFFFSRTILTFQHHLCFHTNFRIISSSSMKNDVDILRTKFLPPLDFFHGFFLDAIVNEVVFKFLFLVIHY